MGEKNRIAHMVSVDFDGGEDSPHVRVTMDGRPVFTGSPDVMDPRLRDLVRAAVAYGSPEGSVALEAILDDEGTATADVAGVAGDGGGAQETPRRIEGWVPVPDAVRSRSWSPANLPNVRATLSRGVGTDRSRLRVDVDGYVVSDLEGDVGDEGRLLSEVLPAVGDAVLGVMGAIESARGFIASDAAVLHLLDDQPAVNVGAWRAVRDARRSVWSAFSSVAEGDVLDMSPR